MLPDFKLESQPVNAPRVGDRYIRRDQVATVIEVTDILVVFDITSATERFTKGIPLGDFETLRQRSLEAGAVFKPAQADGNPRPSVS